MKKRNKSHHGLSIIEFTFVVTALFLIMFWVMEAGRYMYSLQLINNATRVSARLAVVCRVQDQADIPLLAVPKPLLGGFSASDIDIEYLDSNGSKVVIDVSSKSAEMETYSKINYVRAKVNESFKYQLSGLLSLFGVEGAISIPSFETIRPRENLGYHSSDSEDVYTDC